MTGADKPSNANRKWRVEYVTVSEESEGPDYHYVCEFRVIDNTSGRIVKRFVCSHGDGIGYSCSRGTKNVEISEDEQFALVTEEDGEIKKIPLP
jgi:hypothetical protein